MPFKRLTDVEIQTEKEKVLYRYDEKFTIGHKCKSKELQVLVIQELEEKEQSWLEDLEGDESVTEDLVVSKTEEKSMGQSVKLSIN